MLYCFKFLFSCLSKVTFVEGEASNLHFFLPLHKLTLQEGRGGSTWYNREACCTGKHSLHLVLLSVVCSGQVRSGWDAALGSPSLTSRFPSPRTPEQRAARSINLLTAQSFMLFCCPLIFIFAFHFLVILFWSVWRTMLCSATADRNKRWNSISCVAEFE